MTTQDLERSEGPERSLPALAIWLLAAAALVAVAVSWTSGGAFAPFRSFHPGPVIQGLDLASPFAIAAAVLVGLPRWPAGRRWLIAGAAAFAVLGVLGLALEIMFAAASGNFEAFTTAEAQYLLAARGLAAGLVGVIAPLLLAIGLSRGGPAVPMRPGRLVATALLAVLALAAAVPTVRAGLSMPPSASAIPDAVWSVSYVVLAGSAIAIGALGIAAMRVMPTGGPIRERLIAAGAATMLVAAAWTQWAVVTVPRNVPLPASWYDWSITAPGAVDVIGMLVLMAGFVAAGLRARAAA